MAKGNQVWTFHSTVNGKVLSPECKTEDESSIEL